MPLEEIRELVRPDLAAVDAMYWAVERPPWAALVCQTTGFSVVPAVARPCNSNAYVIWEIGSPASAPFLASSMAFTSCGFWLPAVPPFIVNLTLTRTVQGTATPFTVFGLNTLLKRTFFAG